VFFMTFGKQSQLTVRQGPADEMTSDKIILYTHQLQELKSMYYTPKNDVNAHETFALCKRVELLEYMVEGQWV